MTKIYNRLQDGNVLVFIKTIDIPDCQGFNFRIVGSTGKRERRTMRNNHDGSYNLLSATSDQIKTKFPEVRNKCKSAPKNDFHYTRSNRILLGNNTDSGLGESTPQEFSSCCSSSADSTRPIHTVHLFLYF